MHRFCIAAELLAAEKVALPAEVAQQVTRVLRLRAGATVTLFCGDGRECLAVLEEVSVRSVTARLVEWREADVELGCRLHVIVAALKGEKLDWVVQKLTEIGACRISIVQSERTVVAGEERWPRRMERYRRIAREAAEQSGRVSLPELPPPSSFLEALAPDPGALRLILDPLAGTSLIRSVQPCPDRVTLYVGPEGGFTEAEVDAARRAGVLPVSLGRRILRAETAAVAAAAVVAAAAEEDART